MKGFASLLFAANLWALDPPPHFRLPDDVTPTRYAVSLFVDPAKDTFDGEIEIDVRLDRAQSVIWLNAKELKVSAVKVGRQTAHPELVGDEFLALQLDRPVGPGNTKIAIRYTAQLRDKPTVGAFRTRFENNWYAFTTFTAIDARRAFPCFDEPRFKTKWNLTLKIPKDLRAFSNAPELEEKPNGGDWKTVRFQPTPLLASEVLAFAVGPFDILSAGKAGERGIPVRVITPAGHAAEGADAARFTPDVMAKLERYTGVPYPWAKLDHMALPEGTFGGVEQPGLITYRLRGLLRAPGKATPEQDRSLRSLLTHELAHQWFGNLVTQATWDDVWLSEGFATWLTYRMTDLDLAAAQKHVAAVRGRERIMGTDAGPSTRPVRLHMESRDEMKGVYSQFVYQKAGAVLLMVEDWLGEDKFRAGLQIYLRAHRNGNASLEDLAAALKQASGADTGPVLHSFLDRAGVPEIHPVLRCEAGKSGTLRIDPAGWTIPVCFTGAEGSAGCLVFDDAHKERQLNSCPAWLNPNAQGAGYYRSILTPEQLTAIPPEALTEAERAAIKR